MARRGRRGRKGRGKKRAFPILLLAPIIPGVKTAWDVRQSGPMNMLRQGTQVITGIDINGTLPWNQPMALKTAGLLVVGIVGHKVANKVGINKWIKKMSMGYLEL